MQTPKTLSDDERWRAVLDNDAGLDGVFVYAVSSTGIYCRPSCPSRRPGRDKVAFYPLPEAAEGAGYRACKRCRPKDADPGDPKVAAVRAACRLIGQAEGTPTLAGIASGIGLGPQHFQRLFKGVMGISPRQYADALRMKTFRAAVRDGNGVAGAAYEAGYGSSSRLYERAGQALGMTPASYGKGGRGARIRYALADCALGRLLVAATETGVCFLAFGDDDEFLVAELGAEFPAAAEITADAAALGAWLGAVLARLAGGPPHDSLPLDIRATAFQRRVWQALTDIPHGETRTYSEIAAALGAPKGQRAVGRACATNPVSLAIPCHRAIRADGGLGGYRWGLARKQALLDAERDAARDG